MKNVFRILPLAFALLLFSCGKEEVKPVTPGSTSTVHVEYRVYAASSNATVYQDVPMTGQNTLVQEKVVINRTSYSFSFDVVSGTMLRLDATNTNPGSEEVMAEIFVNDQLLYYGSATAPAAHAVAAGIARE